VGRSPKTDRSSTPSKQTRDPEATKTQILDAAEEEFARYGLNGARTEAIAAKTGVTKAMIYYYFGSKENLYQAVLKSYPDNFLDVVERLNTKDLSPEEALKAMIRAGIAHEISHPHQGKVLLHEAMQNGGKFFKLTGGWEEAIGHGMAILNRGVTEGYFRPLDSFLTMIHIMGVITFYFNAENNLKNIDAEREWLSPSAIEQLTESAIAFILAGVRATGEKQDKLN
jgi:TetR/AcrR family transcriptional regulator